MKKLFRITVDSKLSSNEEIEWFESPYQLKFKIQQSVSELRFLIYSEKETLINKPIYSCWFANRMDHQKAEYFLTEDNLIYYNSDWDSRGLFIPANSKEFDLGKAFLKDLSEDGAEIFTIENGFLIFEDLGKLGINFTYNIMKAEEYESEWNN